MKLCFQRSLENFLEVVRSHSRYLEGLSTSGLLKRTNFHGHTTLQYLFYSKKKLTPPVTRCFGNRFFKWVSWLFYLFYQGMKPDHGYEVMKMTREDFGELPVKIRKDAITDILLHSTSNARVCWLIPLISSCCSKICPQSQQLTQIILQ